MWHYDFFIFFPLFGILFQEKQKEKRSKKDKKDKEKREGKEKKDKKRSKEKHSDKKDRKEKHKDKDRDRDKAKNRTSDEKRVAGQADSYKVEKLVPNNLQNVEVKDAKYVQELARRIRDEERATESQMVQKFTVTGQRGSEFLGRVVESNLANCTREQRKIKDEKDGRPINGQRNHVDTRSLGSAIGGNFSVMDHRRVGLALPVEKDVEKPKDGKEKNKHKESDGKKVDKPKDNDREKKSKSKVKDEAKEKKKEEKAKEKAKQIIEQSKQQPKLPESGRESLDTCNAKQFYRSGMSNNSTLGEGNLGKRKEPHKNGSLLGESFLYCTIITTGLLFCLVIGTTNFILFVTKDGNRGFIVLRLSSKHPFLCGLLVLYISKAKKTLAKLDLQLLCLLFRLLVR